ncbi:MAG: hypothetical protein VYB54_04210 [Pseudomonadota bacterium]|nr:hypothetical protein [Pseudomonadota bacterium]
MARMNLPMPILVGGGAAELYTGGEFLSGDLDIVTPHQSVFEREIQKFGFVRSSGNGKPLRGFFHPTLDIGIEVVGSVLMDGQTSRDHIRIFDFSGQRIRIIAPEDLIADRMAQAFSGRSPDSLMIEQACLIYTLAEGLDFAYLNKRISAETGGSADLQTLLEWAGNV